MTGRFSVQNRGIDGSSAPSGATEIGEVLEPHRSDGSSALQQEIDAPRQKLEKRTPHLGKGGRIDPTELPDDPVTASITGAHAGAWHKKGAILVTAKQVD